MRDVKIKKVYSGPRQNGDTKEGQLIERCVMELVKKRGCGYHEAKAIMDWRRKQGLPLEVK